MSDKEPRRLHRIKQKSEEGQTEKVIKDILNEDIDELLSAKKLHVNESHKRFISCKNRGELTSHSNLSPHSSTRGDCTKKESFILISSSQRTISAIFLHVSKPGRLCKSQTLSDLTLVSEDTSNTGLKLYNSNKEGRCEESVFIGNNTSNTSLASFVLASEDYLITAIDPLSTENDEESVNKEMNSCLNIELLEVEYQRKKGNISKTIHETELFSAKMAKPTEAKKPENFQDMMVMMKSEWKNLLSESMEQLKRDLQKDIQNSKQEKRWYLKSSSK